MRATLKVIALAVLTGAAPVCAGAGDFAAPYNAWGQPDISGAWTNATITPTLRAAEFGERGAYSEAEAAELEGIQQAGIEAGNAPVDNTKPLTDGIIAARGGLGIQGNYDRAWFDPGSRVMRVGGEPRNSLIRTPDGRVPPRKDGAGGRGGFAGAGGRGARTDNPETMSQGDRCLVSFGRNAGPPMLPNGFYNNNYQIQQGREAVAIMTEMVHDTRIVRLNSTHRTDGVRPWFGDSIGWYDGDALVVETTNIPESQAYYGAWETLTVTERFTRVAPDRLLYQFTVEDPQSWDAPWSGEYEFSALNGRVFEYACHEGNYALEGILAGARAEDAETAAAAGR